MSLGIAVAYPMMTLNTGTRSEVGILAPTVRAGSSFRVADGKAGTCFFSGPSALRDEDVPHHVGSTFKIRSIHRIHQISMRRRSAATL